MPYVFPDRNSVPPGGWRYRQDETKTLITGHDWGDLLNNIISHRKANNIPIGAAFEHAVEYSVCELLRSEGTAWCISEVRGWGDRVYAVAHPIATIIDKVAGTNLKECGSCQQRRERLNRR